MKTMQKHPIQLAPAILLLLGLALGLALADRPAQALTPVSPLASYELSTWTVDSGGVIGAANGAYRLSATAGQPDAAVSATNAGYSLSPGFWPGGVARYKTYLPLALKKQ